MANLIFKDTPATTPEMTMAQYRQSQSKFTAGRVFSVTGAKSKQQTENEDDIPSPEDTQHFIFTTDIDANTNIWLSQYTRPKNVDKMNQVVMPDGSFDKLVLKYYESAIDSDTVLSAMQKAIDELNGRKIRVRRKFFIPFGGYRARSIPCFDIVD